MNLTSGDHEVIRVGSQVRVKDESGEEEFAVVGPEDADAIADRVSAESPIGRALLGRRKGDFVTFRAPGGLMGVHVVHVD